MAKEPHITGWKELWNHLEPGPRGALIGLLTALVIVLFPIVIKLVGAILFIILATMFGAGVGKRTV